MYTLHAIHDSLDNIPPAKQHQYKQYHTVPYHAKLPYQLTICLKISRILAVLTFPCMDPSLFRGTFCKNRTGTGRMVPQTVDIHIYCLSVWKLVFFCMFFDIFQYWLQIKFSFCIFYQCFMTRWRTGHMCQDRCEGVEGTDGGDGWNRFDGMSILCMDRSWGVDFAFVVSESK